MVHEWALAEAIAKYIEERARGRRVEKVIISLGVLQSIDKEILDFALKNILDDAGIKVDKVEYVDEEVVLKCRKCGHTWKPSIDEVDESIKEAMHFVPETVYSYFKCPRCGSRDFDIISGRGISIKEVILGGKNK